MARPQKNDAERLNRRLPAPRCTEEEYASVQAKAAQTGVSVSEYLRRMALSGKVVVRQSQADFDLIYQLKKIGVNINQQTRRLHEEGEVPDELRHLWAKLDAALNTLFDDTTGSR